jgi:hypothetical protein
MTRDLGSATMCRPCQGWHGRKDVVIGLCACGVMCLDRVEPLSLIAHSQGRICPRFGHWVATRTPAREVRNISYLIVEVYGGTCRSLPLG